MNTTEYKNNYLGLTIEEYKKMTMKQLLEIASLFLESLDDNNCHRFIKSSGDDWTASDEIRMMMNIAFKNKVPCNSKIKRKKGLLIQYVIALDVAYCSMYEVMQKHSYHYYLGHESKHYGFITLDEVLKG